MTLEIALLVRRPVSNLETKRTYNAINLPTFNGYQDVKPVQIGWMN